LEYQTVNGQQVVRTRQIDDPDDLNSYVDAPTLTGSFTNLQGSDIINVRYFDGTGNDANALERTVVWRQNGNPTPQGVAANANDPECARTPTTVCTQTVVYFRNVDGAITTHPVANVTTRGDLNLGRGTLAVSGGELTITDPDGNAVTIADVIEIKATEGATAVVNLDDVKVNLDGVTADLSEVEADLSKINIDVKHTLTAATTNPGKKDKTTVYGHSAMHVSSQFDLGAVTLGLGYTETEHNDPKKKMDSKTTYLGLGGGIGDTGASWVMQVLHNEAHAVKDERRSTVRLSQSVGE